MYFIVLRSQTRLIRQSPVALRNCWVSIEPNFKAISMQWLARNTSGTQNANGPSPSSQSQVATTSSSSDATPLQNRRRFSIASCRNVFEIDGLVQETGFDFLSHVSAADDVIARENQPHDQTDEPADMRTESGENSFTDIDSTFGTPENEVISIDFTTFSNDKFLINTSTMLIIAGSIRSSC